MAELKNDSNYRTQLCIKRNPELIQNLRNKGYDVPFKKKNGYDFIARLTAREQDVEEYEQS